MPDDAAIDELLEGLNPPQREAVDARRGAAAGPRGRRLGQDARAHPPDRLPAAHRARRGPARSSRSRSPTRPRRRCASASSCCVGRATRAMWVMTFHSACARMLRAEAHRLGYTRQFTIYDAGRLAAADQAVPRRPGHRPQALHARARCRRQISDAKNKLRSAEAYRQLVGSYFEQTVADVYELYERELHRMNAMDFDDLLVPRGQPARAVPGGPRPLRRARSATSSSTSTRTPTTPSTAGSSCSPREHRNLAVVGDDASRSTASAAPTSATSSTSRTTSRTRTSSSSSRTTARRRRSSTPPTRSIAQQPRAAWPRPVDRRRRGRPDQGPRARRRARRGALRRRRDRAARRRGRLARGDRRLLPDQRAVAGARGHARARARSPTR